MTRPQPILESEAAVLLAAAAAVDNRIVTDATATEWARALQPYSLDECLAALRQFRASTVGIYLEPGHIRERAAIARRDRQDREAQRRGLPCGPLAKPETRAQTLARVRADVARVRAEREQHTTTSEKRERA